MPPREEIWAAWKELGKISLSKSMKKAQQNGLMELQQGCRASQGKKKAGLQVCLATAASPPSLTLMGVRCWKWR